EEPHTVRARLDKACASTEWETLFPEARVRHLPSLQFDHSTILVETVRDQQLDHNKKMFRFEAMWLRSPDCEEVVREHWGGTKQGSALSALQQKIRNCRVGLLQWDRTCFGNVRKRIRDLEERAVQLRGGAITTESKRSLAFIRHELEELRERQELLLKQRSKGIQRVITNHFDALFQSTNLNIQVIEEILGVLEPKIAPKVTAIRLKPFLSNLISKSQSAFISGRLITDNVLAYKINHHLGHKHWGKEGHIALKLDADRSMLLKAMIQAVPSYVMSVFRIPNMLLGELARETFGTRNWLAPSESSGTAPQWKFIWSTRIPPKVQLFAWRMCKQALPTTSNLHRRVWRLQEDARGATVKRKI
ncbi:UNVERIFIED_CONTAM: hypothetical protein Sradi_4362300, partial [Sesamum radiatum]